MSKVNEGLVMHMPRRVVAHASPLGYTYVACTLPCILTRSSLPPPPAPCSHYTPFLPTSPYFNPAPRSSHSLRCRPDLAGRRPTRSNSMLLVSLVTPCPTGEQGETGADQPGEYDCCPLKSQAQCLSPTRHCWCEE